MTMRPRQRGALAPDAPTGPPPRCPRCRTPVRADGTCPGGPHDRLCTPAEARRAYACVMAAIGLGWDLERRTWTDIAVPERLAVLDAVIADARAGRLAFDAEAWQAVRDDLARQWAISGARGPLMGALRRTVPAPASVEPPEPGWDDGP